MSAAKRPASNSFGSSHMVVKRQKSSADINGKAVAVTNSGPASGALIQAVSVTFSNGYRYQIERMLSCHGKEGPLMDRCA